ncbi:MAG: ATP-dependent Clp protease adaptor ClpS [Nitrospirae bacterium]|nr:ATP-dependent Clp protease adaptor ClpS [Nitrospirota bacterium]
MTTANAPLAPAPRLEEMPEENPGVGTVVLDEEQTTDALPYYVILFNDDFHTIDQVVLQVQKATGASLHDAFEITMQAHANGKAVCYTGDLEECEKVANILREIKLTAEVDHYAGA